MRNIVFYVQGMRLFNIVFYVQDIILCFMYRTYDCLI